MTFEDLIQPGLNGIFTTAISGFFGLIVLYFRRLTTSVATLRESIDKHEDDVRELFGDHEGKDQDRHVENLYRFEKIAVALAKLGVQNGTYEEKSRA